MPTIIDELTVRLGLDATNFKKGQREVDDAWQKARGTQLKHARDTEDSNKKLLESFNKLKVEALGFFAALVGAREIKEFVANINNADAAVGRLAANIGESPQTLQAWGAALERVGGKQEDAAASLTRISKAFYDLKYNGAALPKEVYQLFALAGRPVPTQADSLDSFLNKTAGALKELATHDRTAAFFFGEGMGLTDSMITLMLKYGDATSKYVNSLKGLGATDKQIENAQKLVEAWNKLAETTVAIGRDIESWFSPAFLKTLEWIQSVFDDIHLTLSGQRTTSTNGKYSILHLFGLDSWNKSSVGSGGSPAVSGSVTETPLSGGGTRGGGGASGGSTSRRGRAGLAQRLGQYSGGVGGDSSGYYKPDQQSRVLAMMDQLVNQHGWTPEAAAIAAGNAVQESNVKTGAVGDGGMSKGLFQWNHERLARLQAFGGANWMDPKVQTAFMAQEAEKMVPGWKSTTDLNSAGQISYAYEGFADKGEMNPGSGRMRSISAAMDLWRARKAAAASSGGADGPVVFGDSIAQGLKDLNHSQGAAVQGMGSKWIQNQIENFGGDLKGKKIVLSTGASNSHDPDAVIKQLDALSRKGVSLKDITILGVGDRGDFAGYNDRLKAIADYTGAKFQPITPGGDHVHPRDYHKLWEGIQNNNSGVPGPQSSLSTLHAVHPVTTSSTANTTHINGGIHVNAPEAKDADGIASAIQKSLHRYNMAMAGQSGQV